MDQQQETPAVAGQSAYKHFVLPRVYLIGYTGADYEALRRYLTDTDQVEFLADIEEAKAAGLSDGEVLCSFYGKSCYRALTGKHNKNISRTRSIESNLHNIVESFHGSVTEHCFVNFMVTSCSRLYTHEQVRHRSGAAYSQTSGRYVRTDQLDVVIDPILEPAYDLIEEARAYLESWYARLSDRLRIDEEKSFDRKKKLTSAMRRMLPNAQSNEIGVSLNLRALRHTIEMRTSRHAEWEIRCVFAQIYALVRDRFPAIFFDAHEEEVDGQLEVTFEHKKI